MHCSARRSKLASEFFQLQLDGAVISALPNVRYLSGFTGSNAVLVIGRGGESVLFTDPRYELRAAQESDCEVRVKKGSLVEAAAKYITRRRWRTVGFEAARLTVASCSELQERLPKHAVLKGTSGWVERYRMVKSAGEIEAIRASVELNSTAFKSAIRKLTGRTTEAELAGEIEYQMRKLGAEKPSFETIVASGSNSALPHAQPRNEMVGTDRLLLVDMGAMLDGYASDMTRMLHLGNPGKKAKTLYKAVLEAQLAATDSVRPGMKAGGVDAVARKVLRRYGMEEAFVHSTGHGVGLEIHEAPRLGKRDGTPLEPGMVITIEPGAYLPGFGGVRIEDMVLVTSSGGEVLTPTSRELLTV